MLVFCMRHDLLLEKVEQKFMNILYNILYIILYIILYNILYIIFIYKIL